GLRGGGWARARVLRCPRSEQVCRDAGVAARLRCRRRPDLRGAAIARLLQVGVGFAVSALAIFLLLRQVPLDQLGLVLSQVQPVPIGVLVGCVLASLLSRAARWQGYFLPERRVRFKPLLETLAISSMARTVFPPPAR